MFAFQENAFCLIARDDVPKNINGLWGWEQLLIFHSNKKIGNNFSNSNNKQAEKHRYFWLLVYFFAVDTVRKSV